MLTPESENVVATENVEGGTIFVAHADIVPGHLCGYVHYPSGGPDAEMYDLGDGPRIRVHGGVTYEKRGEEGYTAGFDCAHAGDRIDPKTSDPEWVMQEARRMHEQIRAHKVMADAWRRHLEPAQQA